MDASCASPASPSARTARWKTFVTPGTRPGAQSTSTRTRKRKPTPHACHPERSEGPMQSPAAKTRFAHILTSRSKMHRCVGLLGGTRFSARQRIAQILLFAQDDKLV